MDEFKASKKEESFDEILLRYKMESEIKKGKSSDGQSSRAHHGRHGRRPAPPSRMRSSDAKPFVAEHTRKASESTSPWAKPNIQQQQFRRSNYEIEIQKRKFSQNIGVEKEAVKEDEEERPMKVVLFVDPKMAYYDENLVEQCRFPVYAETNMTVAKCCEALQKHWNTSGKKSVVKSDGSFSSQMLYVVMPSLEFMSEHITGDGLKDVPLAKELANEYESGSGINAKLLIYVTSLIKHFKRVKQSNTQYTDEINLWLELLSLASDDIDAFVMTMKEDIVTIRCFQVLQEKRLSTLKEMQAQNNLVIKEEKDVDFEVTLDDGDGISVVFEKEKKEKAEKVPLTPAEVVSCPIRILVELNFPAG